MSDIVIRFSTNKREVGILKSSQSKACLPNAIKDVKSKGDNNKTYLSLKFKCFEKYRNFDDSPYKTTLHKPDVNNEEMRLIGNVNDLPKQEVLTKTPDRTLIRSKSEIKNEESKSLKPPREIRPVKLKREISTGKPHSKLSSITKALKNFINELRHNSSDEEESERNHPNRRLQRERPDCDLPVKRPRFSRPRPKSVVVDVKREFPEPPVSKSRWFNKRIKEEKEDKPITETKPIKMETSEKENNKRIASKMWEQVLDSPHLEDEETRYIKEKYGTSDSETDDEDDASEADYTGMLGEFVSQQVGGDKTLYERRVAEMMRDPNRAELVKEFYIPPALVEALFFKMAQDQTAEKSLLRVCAAKQWPKPEFSCQWAGKDGFIYSCTLKTKTFVHPKPASNEELAKELAALQCLEWLGFQKRSLLGISDTYFP